MTTDDWEVVFVSQNYYRREYWFDDDEQYSYIRHFVLKYI